MNKLDRDIEKIEQQLSESREKLANLTNRKREKERAQLFKKQIIIGQFFLDKMQKSKDYSDQIISELEPFITKPKERELFNLQSVTTSDLDETEIKNTKESSLIKYN
tara:strand:- start:1445 stop:1765 length:321 start_codon:yes stop_codon:yes gene_type:complete